MIPRFAISNFLPRDSTTPTTHWNVFDAPFKDIRFRLSAVKVMLINASTESNLPALAKLELGDPALWWILAQFNGIDDPILDVYPGLQVRIPSRQDVVSILEYVAPTSGTTSRVTI